MEIRDVRPEEAEAVRRVVAAAFGDGPGEHGAEVGRPLGRGSAGTRGPASSRAGRDGGRRPRRAEPRLGRRAARAGRGVGAQPALGRTRTAAGAARHGRSWRLRSRRRGGAASRRCSSRAAPSTTAPAVSSGPTGAASCRRRSSGRRARRSSACCSRRHEDWMTGQLIYPGVWWEHGCRRAARPRARRARGAVRLPRRGLTRTPVRLMMDGCWSHRPAGPARSAHPTPPTGSAPRATGCSTSARPTTAPTRRCAATRSCSPASRCCTSRPTRPPAGAG